MPEVGPISPPDKVSRASRTIRALAFLGLLAAVVFVIGGCAAAPDGQGAWPGFFAPPATSAEGKAIDSLYFYVFLIAVGVFLLVEGLLLWIVLRYRRRPADGGLPTQTHGHNGLEILWTLIPAAIVTALFVATIDTLAFVEELDPEPQGVVVDVVGFQWQWTFRYEDEGLSFTGAGTQGPVMAIPVNERVRIRLHAQDVIHSFYVPMFRYKQDVVPGRVNQFDIVVEEPGVYSGQCAEFCGLLHADMHFTVEAMSRADYEAWVVEQRAAQPTPGPTPPPDAATVQVTSLSVVDGFEPTELSVPADTPWVVELINADPAVPHDFAIRGGNPDGSDWDGDPDAQGGETVTYQPPPLAAGTYEFYCSLHPNMVGTLSVGE
ncbi:MAG TPA: cytochrome c oxidase subunit II [Candidatus Limnocylindrales bacterium]|nr:cytochrome c oxidase subunit II [Candidatus Limnocylindrales bacterium]